MPKKPKTYWNHRIVTKLFANGERGFSILEVHYEKGKPTSYGEGGSILIDHTSVKDLKWTLKKAKKAFKKPILDADNWPKKWKPTAMQIFLHNILDNGKSF